MNLHAYTILHYGRDFLPYAIRSVYDFVDFHHIIYTPHPSHGYITNTPPIETREELVAASKQYDPDNKIRWWDVDNFYEEGKHRDWAVNTCRKSGANVILVVDADEVWPAETLTKALAHIDQNRAGRWLVNMVHFWRSFNWVCRDNAWPIRFFDFRPGVTLDQAYLPKETGDIYHFGYAVTEQVLRYKASIHGHHGEWRPDWFDTKWAAWPPPEDCHPTNERGWWNPEPFDKEQLPEFMRSHPFWGRERVE